MFAEFPAICCDLGKVVAPKFASNVQRQEKDAGTDNFEKRLDEIKRCWKD